MNRRTFVRALPAGLVPLAGCQLVVPSPQDVRVHNFHNESHTVTMVVTRLGESEPVLRETFVLEPQENRLTRAAFPDSGEYQLSVELSSGTTSTTEWEIDSRGLRIEITSEAEVVVEYQPRM